MVLCLHQVDTGIVGQLGKDELAALGVNNSVFGFAFVVFVSDPLWQLSIVVLEVMLIIMSTCECMQLG